MTRDELRLIIAEEPARRATLAEVQGEIDKIAPHMEALTGRRDSLRAELAVMDKARAEFAAEQALPEPEPEQEPEPEPVAEVASEVSEPISTEAEQETSNG